MDAKIINDYYDFLKWILLKIAKFPRNFRYTFGERLENLLLNIMELLIEAKYTKERRSLLQKANLQLEILRHYIRLSYDIKLVTDKEYEFTSKQLNLIGNQLGGWLKGQNNNA
ncbi:MAG: diversity-generating retroelement protein Avd [Candidatus Cloacimonetes bacterium]|nr:diversity-generating retroelement protein Avd [Candidatus Cloacimonadota bacterium]